MLRNANIRPVLPTTDLKRARAFYEGKLGLEVLQETAGGDLFLRCGNTNFTIYEREGAVPSEYTACAFEVPDAEATIKRMQAAGITFEEYDTDTVSTKDGIAQLGETRGGWFKDPDGHLIAVFQYE